MEVTADWMIVASKLYAALKSVQIVHTPGCDVVVCAACKQAYDAREIFLFLQKSEEDKLAQKSE